MQATDMNWLEVIKIAVSVAVLLAPLIWALIVYHGDTRWTKHHHVFEADRRPKFATVTDLDGLGKKLSAMETLYINTRERVDVNHDRLTTIETDAKSEQRRVTEVLINPMRELTEELHELRQELEKQGRCLVEIQTTLKGRA